MPRYLFLILLLMLAGCNDPYQQQPAAATPAKKQQSNGDESFHDLSGKAYRKKDLEGKVLLIVHWATWCPPCLKEIPALNELHEKYRERGLVVLAVSQDHRTETLKNFLEKSPLGRSISYPVIYGDDYPDIFTSVELLPTILIVDREGYQVLKQEGAVPAEALSKVIEEVL